MKFKIMNTFKYKFYSASLCVLCTIGVGCTDYDDYNDVPSDATPSSGLSLMENLQQNAELSDFTALVKQAGFETELSSPRSLTIWAPKNGTFNADDFKSLSKDELLTQFVKGHVAQYSHAASGKVDERVHMLNNKSFTFAGDGTYTFDGLTISKTNIPSANGLIHQLEGAAKFYPNLYEYLMSAPGIDSLRAHFKRYEHSELDQNASVKGPMVNGVQTYIDSVMITYNSMLQQMRASIENEDSSYTFVMPLDTAFNAMYNKVKPYYNFINTTKVFDVSVFEKANDTKTKTATVNAAYYTDSLVRYQIVRNLVYSNNDQYNKWVVGKGDFTDSLRATTRYKFSNPYEIIKDHMVGSPVEMSNGYARLVDSIAFHPWESYCPELSFTLYGSLVKNSVITNGNGYSLFPTSAQLKRMKITSADGQPLVWLLGPETTETSFTYGWIEPGGDRAKPDFYLALPDVMSTTYNFYVVFMPSAKLPGNQFEDRPNLLNFQLLYCDANGNTQTYNFSKEYADSLRSGGALPKVPTSVNANTAFSNDPEKTDTVFVGQFKFPVNYKGLGQEYYPSLHVTSPISVFNSTQLATYTRDVRIAAILLRPVELDEYEAKNK